MSANFDLANLALQAVCPGNELLYDDKGMPSVMVKIPKMTYAELGMGTSRDVHPAFIVNDTEVSAIYISKYQNVIYDDRAYSMPGVDPCSANFDTAFNACATKGSGWHLMTRMEWGLLVRWCQNNGVMPRGNNSYGRCGGDVGYKAIPSFTRNNRYAYRTATGTGPLTWYHDQSPSGIADLCGNVSEWMGGLRTVGGELQVLADNNGADSAHSQASAGAEWRAINAFNGSLIVPDGSGTTPDSIKLDFINGKLTYATTITDPNRGKHTISFADIVCGTSIGDDAKQLLQTLGLMMFDSNELFASHTCIFYNDSDEKYWQSGGDYTYSSYGLATFLGFSARGHSEPQLGFRAAFAEI